MNLYIRFICFDSLGRTWSGSSVIIAFYFVLFINFLLWFVDIAEGGCPSAYAIVKHSSIYYVVLLFFIMFNLEIENGVKIGNLLGQCLYKC